MKNQIYLGVLFFLLLTSAGCSNNDGPVDEPDPTPPIVTGPPVETRPKDAPDQQPAFAGQTRGPSVKTQTVYKVNIVANGLRNPWGLDFLPDGRMIVSERPGAIRIVTSSGTISNPITGVPAVRAVGEGGMLDVKLAPDFASSRIVFWAFVEPVGNNSISCIARGRLSANETAFEDVKVIYRGTSPYDSDTHFGARMVFDSNGLLYATFGERADNAIRAQAQELTSSLGKIIRINQDGTPAAGNPFQSNGGARKEIWSLGHRHPQGLAFNPVNGELWESEHGPQAGDEINIIKAGANYGWPIIAYGLEYGGSPVNGTGITQQSGMEQPVYYWDPAVAPSGMTFFTGNLMPEWKNNLFVAILKGTHIVRLVIDNETHRIIGEEQLLLDQKQRFRHVVQGPDGALYALTDNTAGRIYRIGN